MLGRSEAMGFRARSRFPASNIPMRIERRGLLRFLDRTQACAAAEMGHDNATIGGFRAKDVGQNACDVFIGKAVKPVAPNALGANDPERIASITKRSCATIKSLRPLA
jgi:hypothetical protein